MELLVTGAFSDAKLHIRELKEKGHRVHFLQYEKDELPCPPDQIEGVICNGLFLFHPIERFENLRFIQLTSAGFDRIPMEYVLSHGIEIHNARGVYSIPMAEAVFAGVLTLYRKMYEFRRNQKARVWEKLRDLPEIYGKTVGIFGCGSVGSECAKRFTAFGAHVIGVATAAGHREWFEDVFTMLHVDHVLAESDIVISALPLKKETKHFFDADKFAKMKSSAVFVNISRGAVVDTRALVSALMDKRIDGAVLDVFDEEPLEPDSALWGMENVVITPHNSFVGDGNRERLWSAIEENLPKESGTVYHCQHSGEDG